MRPTVVIIGAGPAGLTAALELLTRSPLGVVVIEALDEVGGISRTVNYKGNRMDIGGHRFFSKSDWVMDWWRAILPVAPDTDERGLSRMPDADRHLLVRPRLSRIYFLRKFFAYPVTLSAQTLRQLGLVRLLRIAASYAGARLAPRRPERHLEDFFINRFGRELYRTFFKDYTEKVWGVPCERINPDWGAQRIKGLSVTRALLHALKKLAGLGARDLRQQGTNTSLIERFLYPKHGPGQMWQVVAERVRAAGGEIRHGLVVRGVELEAGVVRAVRLADRSGSETTLACDHVISTMPIRDLAEGMRPPPPADVLEIARGLCYRDFITVGLLVRKLRKNAGSLPGSRLNIVPDTWIYIQEPDVRLGRLQVFNNWSPALVRDPDTVWLGLEYFCQEGDELWRLDDAATIRLAAGELATIGLIDAGDVLDAHVVRVPKAYPAYFGTYDRFDRLRQWFDAIGNLYLVGRNGMHRYNNQDHSMLTARLAVDAILAGGSDRSAIWKVNLDDDYHEEKRS